MSAANQLAMDRHDDQSIDAGPTDATYTWSWRLTGSSGVASADDPL